MEHYYNNIQGWFDFQDLYQGAIANAPQDKESVFVEVGTWLGKSLVFFGVEAINSGKPIKIFGVDNFSGSPGEPKETGQSTPMLDFIKRSSRDTAIADFLSNVTPVSAVVTPVVLDSEIASQQFADNSVDFIFIDSDHSYECVKRELEIWYPKLKDGGTFAGHDFGYTSVQRAVLERFPNAVAVGASWKVVK